MKLKFIGAGSAFTTSEYYQSNMLLMSSTGKKMLLDCGSDARFALNECDINNSNVGREIDAIYISHLHADHIGGMEWLAFNTYFVPNPKRPKLFSEKALMHEMWEHSLRGGLGRIEGKSMALTDYFDCCPCAGGGSFTWEGIRFSLIRMSHVKTCKDDHCSYGLLIEALEEKAPPVFITMDTQFQADLSTTIAGAAGVIFHDCETTPFKSIIHAHYDDLCTFPSTMKRKMWLYHYQPHPDRQPVADGFLGFVVKGQEFEFSGT